MTLPNIDELIEKLPTGYTSGPWSVTDESSLTPREPYWIGSEHPEVGRCTFATVRSGCDEADELGDMLANANLIALAPEMAAALSTLQEQKRKLEDELAAERAAKTSLSSMIAPTGGKA